MQYFCIDGDIKIKQGNGRKQSLGQLVKNVANLSHLDSAVVHLPDFIDNIR